MVTSKAQKTERGKKEEEREREGDRRWVAEREGMKKMGGNGGEAWTPDERNTQRDYWKGKYKRGGNICVVNVPGDTWMK